MRAAIASRRIFRRVVMLDKVDVEVYRRVEHGQQVRELSYAVDGWRKTNVELNGN